MIDDRRSQPLLVGAAIELVIAVSVFAASGVKSTSSRLQVAFFILGVPTTDEEFPVFPTEQHHPSNPTGGVVSLHHALPAVVVHTALRRELRLAGPLVRRVPNGDIGRAQLVAGHLDFLLRTLHHHHELEDTLVFPIVRVRASDRSGSALDVMQVQHDQIDRVVQDIVRLVSSWTADVAAVATHRDPLADLLEALHELLVEHLDLEERDVLSIAEQYVTAAEWGDVGRRADASIPTRERALTFGMLQHEGDPAVLASMLAPAPLPVRMVVPRLARRAYRRYALAVHGTSSP